MIDIPLYNQAGEQIGTLPFDPAPFGARVRPALLKQAIVMYHANRRQGTAATKSRGMVEGSTRKIYRQKGTGFARMGTIRSPIRRGGGVTFAKRPRDFRQDMPRKMRRLARRNAVLAKAVSNELAVVDTLAFERPRTRDMATLLNRIGAARGCVLAIEKDNETVWKSARNIPRTDVCRVDRLNAELILKRPRLVMTRAAFEAMTADPERFGAATIEM